MSDDLFGPSTGGGNYPKLDDLEGSLVLLKPSKVETVPGYQSKGTTDRATADTWVFGTTGEPEFYADMYFSQAGVVPSCKQALKPGARPFVLGVVQKFPSKAMKTKGIDTTAKLQAALDEWLRKGGKGDKPQFAWGLGEYTDEQAAQARALIESMQRSTDPFAAPAS